MNLRDKSIDFLINLELYPEFTDSNPALNSFKQTYIAELSNIKKTYSLGEINSTNIGDYYEGTMALSETEGYDEERLENMLSFYATFENSNTNESIVESVDNYNDTNNEEFKEEALIQAPMYNDVVEKEVELQNMSAN